MWFSGELADRTPGMMTLISLAIIVAFATSLAATFGIFEIDVWWELASLITIMVLGHWLEMRAVSQARGALSVLAALLPDTAERVEGATLDPCIACRRRGACAARGRVPADGTVVEGVAGVDESIITGESKGVPKRPGASVVGGTVASGGSLHVRVTAIGDRSALFGMMRLIAAAQASGSRTQALADRAAAVLFYVAVAAGAIHVHLLVVFERYRTCPNQNRQSALPSWLTLAVATSSMIERSSLGTGSACRLCRRP